jgi:hypothetical protein
MTLTGNPGVCFGSEEWSSFCNDVGNWPASYLKRLKIDFIYHLTRHRTNILQQEVEKLKTLIKGK